jgi:hypothetical protein
MIVYSSKNGRVEEEQMLKASVKAEVEDRQWSCGNGQIKLAVAERVS